MKWLAAVLIMMCALLAGSSLADRIKRRCRLLGQILAFLQYAYGEVSYCQLPPDRILTAFHSTVGSFFDECKKFILSGNPVHIAWELAAVKSPDAAVLTSEEHEQLLELGRSLGCLDRQGQLAAFERSREYFSMSHKTSLAEKQTSTRLYMSCAASFGAIAAILVL